MIWMPGKNFARAIQTACAARFSAVFFLMFNFFVYVIGWAGGHLRINFTCISQNCPSREAKRRGQFWENFVNTSEINPQLPEGTCDYLFITLSLAHTRAFCLAKCLLKFWFTSAIYSMS